MEFDTDYQVQQIPARTRDEKVLAVGRDAIEKHRLAMRHEHFERHHPIDDPVKPVPEAAYAIDDVERFNRDICADQRAYKQATHDMIWKRWKKSERCWISSKRVRHSIMRLRISENYA